MVQISDRTYRIDMESIDPYKKVLSHGGKICYVIVKSVECNGNLRFA